MKRFQQWLFAGAFLALIYAVPLSQAGLEIARGRAPQSFDVFTHSPTQANLRAYERQLEDSSFWAQAVRPGMQYLWFKLLGDAGEKVVVGQQGWLFYRPDLRYLIERKTGDDPIAAIAQFRDDLALRGIRLLILPVPGKPAIYPDKLTRRIARDGALPSYTVELMEQLKRQGIETVNLFPLFHALRRAERNPEAPVYLLRDTHWSGATARAAAALVARRIRELGWVEDGSTGYTSRSLRVTRQSDIARMIRVPGIESVYPPEKVSCDQVLEPGAGGLYRDDPNSPVLILGDSFLRMYQTDAPRAAGFIAHLAREMRRPVASLVNDGGASTLVRQQLSRRPELLRGKRLVIWEFVERDIYYGTEGWKPVPLPETSAKAVLSGERGLKTH